MSDLNSISLFAGLPSDTLTAIENLTSTRQYPKNSVIMNEGDIANSVYLLMSGKVKIYVSDEDGKEFVLNSLSAGACFGEFSLLDEEETRTASVMTLENSHFKVLMKSDFDQLRKDYPEIDAVLITNLVGTIRHLTENCKSLALKDVYGRIRNLLNTLAKGEQGKITEKMTQQEIANRVGSSREMVARILKDLKAGGYIGKENKQITVLKTLPENY
jgi:CRP/FNR family cyclic AMP-dependent transcriptional regulator